MMSGLVYREWQARQSPAHRTGYAAVLNSRFLNTEKQMGIYHSGERVGMTRTAYRFREGRYEIDSYTRFTLPLFGGRPVSIRALLTIDSAFKLTHLKGWLALPVLEAQNVEFEGQVVGEEMEVTFTHHDEIIFRTGMPFVGEEMLADVFSPFTAMPQLSVGKTWQIRMFNPLSKTFETATAVVEAQTTLRIDGTQYRVFQAKVSGRSIDATAWVTPAGEVVRQMVPRWGLMLEKEDPTAQGL
jgi:hypothetical protein